MYKTRDIMKILKDLKDMADREFNLYMSGGGKGIFSIPRDCILRYIQAVTINMVLEPEATLTIARVYWIKLDALKAKHSIIWKQIGKETGKCIKQGI